MAPLEIPSTRLLPSRDRSPSSPVRSRIAKYTGMASSTMMSPYVDTNSPIRCCGAGLPALTVAASIGVSNLSGNGSAGGGVFTRPRRRHVDRSPLGRGLDGRVERQLAVLDGVDA